MDNKHKYEPEDLEHLMLNKSFDQLLPDEKQFVEQHVDSVEEYESMRALLLEIIEISEVRTSIKPNPAIRKRLIKQFKAAETKKAIWWQSLNPFVGDMTWGKALIPIAAVAIIAFFVLNPLLNGETEKGRMAERIEKTVEQNKKDNLETEEAITEIDLNAADTESVEDVESDEEIMEENENTLDAAFISKEIAYPNMPSRNRPESLNDVDLSIGISLLEENSFMESEKTAEGTLSNSYAFTNISRDEQITATISATDYSALLNDLYTSY